VRRFKIASVFLKFRLKAYGLSVGVKQKVGLKVHFKPLQRTYDENFLCKAKARLEQTFSRDNFSELIFDTIFELDREILDDNFFGSWLEFVEKQERRNVEIWLASKGIELDD
jgi:hypothetical protein